MISIVAGIRFLLSASHLIQAADGCQMACLFPQENFIDRNAVNYIHVQCRYNGSFHGKRYGEKTRGRASRHSVRLTHHGLPAIGLILDALDEDVEAL